MGTMNSSLGGAAGYGENSFKANGVDSGNLDDGSIYVDFTSVFGGSGIDFYGSSYTGININTNGILTLSGTEHGYTPVGIAGYGDPAIAPLWVDIDISKGGDIYWDLDPTGGTFTVTWLDAAPYSGTGTNSFQIVMADLGSGDFSVEFIYEDIDYGAVGGSAATAGITDGGINHFEPEGYGNAAFVETYPINDFDGGDPPGHFGLNVLNGAVPCFARGTQVLTSLGYVNIEDVRLGDLLVTKDQGEQPVIWIGARRICDLERKPHLQPVTVKEGALGNSRAITVSPQHAFLLNGRLVRAKHLAEILGDGVAQLALDLTQVDYYHVLTPCHALICAEGVWTETLYPGEYILETMPPGTKRTIVDVFPPAASLQSYGPPVKQYAKRREVPAVVQGMPDLVRIAS